MSLLGIIISCREFDEFIVSYLDGTLPTRQRMLFQGHLAMCSKCRRYLKRYKQTMNLAKIAYEPIKQDRSDVPDDLVKSIMNAKRAADSDRGRP